MRKIYSTSVFGQAQMLQVALRSHGIESRLENEGGAMYAIGFPTPAVPIDLVVADQDADEAARIIAEEFSKSPGADPTQIRVQMKCGCGMMLEYPKEEEPPEECPYCGRAPGGAAASPATEEAPRSSRSIAAAVVVLVVILAALIITRFIERDLETGGIRTPPPKKSRL